jgi:hypothetical protein
MSATAPASSVDQYHQENPMKQTFMALAVLVGMFGAVTTIDAQDNQNPCSQGRCDQGKCRPQRSNAECNEPPYTGCLSRFYNYRPNYGYGYKPFYYGYGSGYPEYRYWRPYGYAPRFSGPAYGPDLTAGGRSPLYENGWAGPRQ